MKNLYKKFKTMGQIAALGMATFCFSLTTINAQTLVSADFSGNTIPTGWTQDSAGMTPTNGWTFNEPEAVYPQGGTPGFDSSYAVLNSDYYGNGNTEAASLVTPSFDASGASQIQLSFDQQYDTYSSEAAVLVYNGSTWDTVATQLDSSIGVPNAIHTTIDITTACGGATNAKVAFYYTGNWDYWWAIDNVKIEGLNNCSGQPSETISVVDSVCKNTSFSLIANGSNDAGITYQWQSSPAGQGTWADITYATTQSSIDSGVSVPTDFRLISTCTISGLSDTSNIETVNLKPILECYCTPTYTYGCSGGDMVDNFELTGANSTSIIDDSTGCSPGAYSDRTSMFAPVELMQDSSYTANISTQASGDNCVIWIDFNNDGVFNNTNEKVDTATAISESSLSATTLTIPGNADTGIHRMRVEILWDTDPSDSTEFDACNAADEGWGEIHDYLVRITNTTTGIKQIAAQNKNVQLYPNPTRTTLYIKNTSGQSIKTIDIFDDMGKMVKTVEPQNNITAKINVGDLATGIYTARIILDHSFATKRFEIVK